MTASNRSSLLARAGLLAPLAALSLAGCGINSVPTAEENVNAKWANVQSEYQRRNDLIGNLVETVKGYAAQEKGVLVGVTEARSRATSTQLRISEPSPGSKSKATCVGRSSFGTRWRNG